jgi:hypothetical protein
MYNILKYFLILMREVIMLEKLEHELYVLYNSIEYYGHKYEDYNDELNELETKIHILKKLKNF